MAINASILFSTTKPSVITTASKFIVGLATDLTDGTMWSVSGTAYTNLVTLTCAVPINPPNTYEQCGFFYVVGIPSFTIMCGGSIFPPANMSQGAQLTILPGDIAFDTSVLLGYLPNTTNRIFPTVVVPFFVPTYEPAALSEPIQYMQNMRS